MSRLAPLIACLLAFLALPGCASEPSVSGFGLFMRTVREGDQITLTSPVDAESGIEWRLASYDSSFIEIAGPLRIEERGGRSEVVATFRAKRAGNTDVVFERRGAAARSDGPARRSFRINILPR